MSFFLKRQGKYNAKSQDYGGVKYHSRKEAAYAQELDWKLKGGLIKSWRRQVKIDLRVNDHHITNYYVDFEATLPDDRIELIEVKGFETKEWLIKWRLLEAIYSKERPDVVLTIVR